MKRHALLLGAVLLLPQAGGAALSASGIGTTGAEFLQLGAGARALALGQAYSALADDATALYWNPAGLARLPQGYLDATVMHAPYIAASYYDYAAVAQDLRSYGAIGASLQYFTVGSVTQTDADGTNQGTITPYDMAASIGYAHEFDGLLVGIAGKYVDSKIATSARTEAVDVGVLSPAFFNDQLRLALVAQNLGGRLRYDQVGADLPRTFKAGGAWRFNEDWTAAADLGLPSNNVAYAALGIERNWQVFKALAFAGRLGFNSQTLSGLNGLTAVSIGGGLSGHDLALDYAFLPMGSLGVTQRISLSYKFQTWKERPAAVAPAVAPSTAPVAASSAAQASVQYSTQTSLPPPARLHCEEYHGVIICIDPDQRKRINISYEPGEQEQPQAPAQPQNPANPAPAQPRNPESHAPAPPPAGQSQPQGAWFGN
jgi:hypothetical protein